MSFSCEESAATSVFESDQKVTEVSAEPTCLRFEDLERIAPDMGSLNIHPKPPLFVAETQAAST